ncbi:MAG: hypothetical protein ABIR91_02245, partial [Candidatus Saccharimonadales bacterium]
MFDPRLKLDETEQQLVDTHLVDAYVAPSALYQRGFKEATRIALIDRSRRLIAATYGVIVFGALAAIFTTLLLMDLQMSYLQVMSAPITLSTSAAVAGTLFGATCVVYVLRGIVCVFVLAAQIDRLQVWL